MSHIRRSTVHYLLFLVAFLWPWSVYQMTPLLWPLTDMLCLVLFVMFLTGVFLQGGTRLPFELIWPVVGMLILELIALIRGEFMWPGVAGWCALFIVTLWSAPSRITVVRWLWLSSVSGGCVAALTLLLPVTSIVPTAYSLRTGAMLAFADDLTRGSFTLLVCFALALGATFSGQLQTLQRWIAAVCAVLIAAALVFVGVPSLSHLELWSPARYGGLTWPYAGMLLFALWVMARAAAKVEVDRRESSSAMHWALLAVVVIMVTWPVVFYSPLLFRMETGVILGLACAYTFTQRPTTEPSTRGWKWLPLVPIAGLLAFNVVWILPYNIADPRHYDHTARFDFLDGDFDTIVRRMEFVSKRYPAERRTRFWLARVELARGNAQRAALEFAEAVEPPGRTRLILPPPSEADQRDFMVRLRDHCSSLARPERTFACEQALAATGDVDSALDLLGLDLSRARTERTVVDPKCKAQFLSAVAFLLGSRAIESHIESWSSDELAILLEDWGAEIGPAPERFPKELLPLVCIAQYGPHTEKLLLFSGDSRWDGSKRRERWADAADGDWSGGGWTVPAQDRNGTWHLSLVHPVDGGVVAQAHIGEGSALEVVPHLTEEKRFPDSPAIRIWLP